MRIDSVEAIVTCPGRNFVLVKITTSNNLTGWGDATLNGRELAVSTLVNEHLAPLLIGEDATRIEHHWNALYTGAYWRGGPIQNSALAGIDMALWDLLGKHAGLPVHTLLGGRVRDHARAYVAVAGKDPQHLIESIKLKVAKGFSAVRIQLVAEGKPSPAEAKPSQAEGKPLPQHPTPLATMPAMTEKGTARLVQSDLPLVGVWEARPYLNRVPKMFASVRAELGDELELLHDVHHRLSPIEAAQLAKAIEPYHPFFYEDPVAPEYKEGLELIRRASSVPIAIGEGFFDIAQFTGLLSARLLDYIRCDLGHIGGISAARKIAHFCEPYCVKTAWHGPPDLSPLGHAANVHVDLSIHNFGIQEWYDHSLDPMLADCQRVFTGGVMLQQGNLNVPDEPGLGVTVDESLARSLPYRRGYLPVVRLKDGSVHPW